MQYVLLMSVWFLWFLTLKSVSDPCPSTILWGFASDGTGARVGANTVSAG